MEKKVMQTYLYDFYGDLLTEHQRNIYEEYVLNDLSLSEIAQEEGISRQGVHDLIRRCDKILKGYEEKLHLLARFLNNKEKILRIRTLSRNYQNGNEAQVMAEIEAISNEILEEL
ncbi:MAG: YlxM family DNA-binding protein [Lachnospiraceae bacterium]|nr:YlxM family DNA-binding protein [Lachnospiraceae bacterium]